VVDLIGWSDVPAAEPARVVDTRRALGATRPNAYTELALDSLLPHAGPSVINITVVNAAAPGHLFPCASHGTASTLNFVPGRAAMNLVITDDPCFVTTAPV